MSILLERLYTTGGDAEKYELEIKKINDISVDWIEAGILLIVQKFPFYNIMPKRKSVLGRGRIFVLHYSLI